MASNDQRNCFFQPTISALGGFILCRTANQSVGTRTSGNPRRLFIITVVSNLRCHGTPMDRSTVKRTATLSMRIFESRVGTPKVTKGNTLNPSFLCEIKSIEPAGSGESSRASRMLDCASCCADQ